MRDLLMPLRVLHGKIYEAEIKRKPWKEVYDLEKSGLRQSSSEKERTQDINDIPIDFVVTWVDGNDPAWLAERNRYIKADSAAEEDNGEERYREWGIFQYWFRTVEIYAPWVRNVFFVTWGHVPSWLNINAPKLKIIKHEDFIPDRYRPTFSTVPIELNLHRIPGLSEQFIYFNDDMFLTRPVEPKDFFYNGLPKLTCNAEPLINRNNEAFDHMQFTTVGVINKAFKGQIKNIIRKNPEKWFSDCYSEDVRHWNRLSFFADYLLGMGFPHLGVPCRKSTMEEVWRLFFGALDETCLHRFRTPKDIIHQIFLLWEMMNASFYPVGAEYQGKHFWNAPKQENQILEAIKNEQYRMICINDSQIVNKEDFLHLKTTIAETFSKKFPEKSTFEK